ncbi:MAG: hypothetical protein KJ579_02955 [Verrucomicrobia bacterium]|nr:hypothetical protein [Verrucomicrobiota bacterium]
MKKTTLCQNETPRADARVRLLPLAVLLAAFAASTRADPPPQLETDMLPTGGGAALLSAETSTSIVARAINAGQLSGRGLDGVELSSVDDLLPLSVQSVLVRNANGPTVLLDGDGIHASQVSATGFGFLDTNGTPVGVVVSNWNDVIEGVNWAAITNQPPRQSLTASQIGSGLIQPQHLSFNPNAAAGGDRAVQYSQAGELAGSTNVFVESAARLGVRVTGRDILRAYVGGQAVDEDLIFTTRRHLRTAAISLYNEGVETVLLRGDGTGQLTGTLRVGRLEVGELAVGETPGADGWYVPESGDLTMGTFTTP